MTSKRYWIPILICLAIVAGTAYFYLFASLAKDGKTYYIYIDADDNIDSINARLDTMTTSSGMAAFSMLARHNGYERNIIPGRYAVKPGMGALRLLRNLKNGAQTPLHLTIPSVRTTDKLAAVLGSKLQIDSLELMKELSDPATCARYGLDTLTIACLFIPNTYDVYWTISARELLDRMQKESRAFWKGDRQSKAKAMGMTEVQVMTLASIVDEETANDAEKPMVAQMYLNRLREDMPLQADPTVKFALKQFDLKRIYNVHLSVNSPFNTYRNKGLPPGPIRIPSVSGIDAVLNHAHHDYLYMCAKEDFSGTHNFAKTYEEHLLNAKRYSEALNKRGIK
ncbi:MAG: endolytic transglycosylase MltG [Prevotella sp.]|nr:endolytic transglycosylase MltG [Prevotella sp.]MDD7317575.1 endolytic transglycosylase MltG [Prevotellaceae bacterium]MDY4020578.1 endolytic transglycosylase MltG [Prevotella sp.]